MEPSEKEGDEKVSDDSPKEEAKETKKEEVQSTAGDAEKEVVTQKVTQAKRSKAANPYGVWERIQEEKDP